MGRRAGVESGAVEPSRKRCKQAPPDGDADTTFQDDEALPPGLLMTDIGKRTWRIGKPIGRGSFGRIYLASDDVSAEVTRLNARYVVKIEPHSNGPLFVEIHVLIRRARAAMVKQWRINNKQKSLGMPIYMASGSFTDEATGTRYRFLVLPRYEVDLQKIISRRGGILDLKNVLVLALQILDVLEYLHEEGYTHSDIKSSNLMLGFDGMKFGKVPVISPASFLKKATSMKQRMTQNKGNRASNYYNDEDFVCKSSSFEFAKENLADKEKRLMSAKKRMRKMLSDRASRNMHRHHAFNLRQLSSHINYEDFNSSICSDESYQRLLDEQEGKYSTDEGFHEEPQSSRTLNPIESEYKEDTFSEAILSQSNGQIYLLDYGLASKFMEGKNHKEFGMDARKAHDGTLEYSSRDSHIGAHSRRSDLETLAFNLLDWLTGTLPWKTTEMLAEPDLVHAIKKNYMDDVKALLRTCFKTEFYPEFLEKYLQYVTSLEFAEKPDYDRCRSIFKAEFVRNGFGSEKDMRLCLSEVPMSPLSRKKLSYSKKLGRNPMKNTPSDFKVRNGIQKYGRENIQSLENDLKLELLKRTLNSSSDGIRKPCASRNFFISDADLVARLKQSLLPLENFGKKLSPKNLRSKKCPIQKKRGKRNKRNSIGKFGNFLGSGRQYSWAEILAGNPEHIVKNLRKEKNPGSDDDDNIGKSRNRKISSTSDASTPDQNAISPLMHKDYLHGRNPTYAMKELHANYRKKMSKKHSKETENSNMNLNGYTPAMLRVIQARNKRETRERALALKEKHNPSKTTNQVRVPEKTTRSACKKSISPEKKTTSVLKKAKTLNIKLTRTKSEAKRNQPVKSLKPKSRSETEKDNTKGSRRKPATVSKQSTHPSLNNALKSKKSTTSKPNVTSTLPQSPTVRIRTVSKSGQNTNSTIGSPMKYMLANLSTPIRKVINSKRRPIVRIVKVRNSPTVRIRTVAKSGQNTSSTIATPVKYKFANLTTPIRKVINSKRKPIVRIVKVPNTLEPAHALRRTSRNADEVVKEPSKDTKSPVTKQCQKSTRSTTRTALNTKVTRSTLRKRK